MLKTIALVVLGCVGIVLLLAAFRLDTFRVERSLAIKAPPDKIFPHLTDFKAWGAWSPWEKKDPHQKRTFSEPPRGPGAHYHWVGNKDVGEGRMEISEAVAPTNVRIKLDFVKPFEAHNMVDFTLKPQGDTTLVRWTMQGPQPFIGKLFGLFVSMDRMVGKDFEAGLAALKAVAEKG